MVNCVTWVVPEQSSRLARSVEDFADLAKQRGEDERLGEERALAGFDAMVLDGLLGVARDVDDAEPRTRLAEGLGELDPVELGHDDVGDEEINLARMAGGKHRASLPCWATSTV